MSQENAVVQSTIKTDDRGSLLPKTIEESFRVANAYFKSGLLPTRFKSPESVMTAMQFVLELGLKPLTAMRQLAVINGTPSLFGDLPLSLCYASGHLESIQEWLIDANQKEISSANGNLKSEAWGAVCVVKRRGDIHPREVFFSMNDADTAGLSKGPVWKAYPKLMLKYRARSQALKDKFPDALNGVSIAEYDFNSIPHENDDEKRIDQAKTVVSKTEEFKQNLEVQPPEPTPVEPIPEKPPIIVKPVEPEKEPKAMTKGDLVRAILELSKDLGMSLPKLESRCRQKWNLGPNDLDEAKLISLLNDLKSLKDAKNDRA